MYNHGSWIVVHLFHHLVLVPYTPAAWLWCVVLWFVTHAQIMMIIRTTPASQPASAYDHRMTSRRPPALQVAGTTAARAWPRATTTVAASSSSTALLRV